MLRTGKRGVYGVAEVLLEAFSSRSAWFDIGALEPDWRSYHIRDLSPSPFQAEVEKDRQGRLHLIAAL